MTQAALVFISTFSDRSVSPLTISRWGRTTLSTANIETLLDSTSEATVILALRKRWTLEDRDGSHKSFEDIQCCKNLKCFELHNQQFFVLQRALILQETQNERRRILSSFSNSLQTFAFHGSWVCNKILAIAFHFSNHMHNSVQKNLAAQLFFMNVLIGSPRQVE